MTLFVQAKHTFQGLAGLLISAICTNISVQKSLSLPVTEKSSKNDQKELTRANSTRKLRNISKMLRHVSRQDARNQYFPKITKFINAKCRGDVASLFNHQIERG
jgi:hypothetical protein